jgi:hypothetical protein
MNGELVSVIIAAHNRKIQSTGRSAACALSPIVPSRLLLLTTAF